MFEAIKEIKELLWQEKMWWLIPPIIVLLLLGLMIWAATGSPLGPFIYTLV